jgi:hypothetical protein
MERMKKGMGASRGGSHALLRFGPMIASPCSALSLTRLAHSKDQYPKRESMSIEKGLPRRTFITGYRPVIHACEGRMLGIRDRLDGPVFDTLQDAVVFCMNVMVSYYESHHGMSDATIERFEGMIQ